MSCCLDRACFRHLIAAIAATLMPPKRPRGARGGNPNRPSQVARRDRGLRSELDTPAEGSTVERPPEPVGPPPGTSFRKWKVAAGLDLGA